MRKLPAIILFLLIAVPTYAMPATSKGGHPACLKEEWINDMRSFVVANDLTSFEAYVNSKKRLILKKGLQVTVTESPGMFGSTATFVYRGIKFWTMKDALNYGN
jgi:hypothetical protein